MRDTYRDWLMRQKYAEGTVQAQLHRAGRVEKHYGDLDRHYEADRLEGIIADLQYSTEDARRSKPNPSKIPFDGDIRSNLASYRDAVARYRRFRDEATDDEDQAPYGFGGSAAEAAHDDATEDAPRQLIGLERDMQAVLRQSIEQLEKGLVVTDDGAERSVSSGFIDISARDASGNAVVIELKTGTARQRAIAQILSYMGDVAVEEPDTTVRGILVASNFDGKARAAARMVPNLSLRRYAIHFEFSDGD